LVIALLLGTLFAGAEEPPVAEPPPAFDQYAFVMLKKGPSWSSADTDENKQLMAQHLGHFTEMTKAGKMVVAGPFSDQVDPDLRGLCIYRTSVEEARALAGADPRVKAGHLQVEVMSWWTEQGALTFPLAQPAAAPATNP
jgi:uncharacterized protein